MPQRLANHEITYATIYRSEVAESVSAANHLDHFVGISEGTRGGGLSAEILLHENAMPSLSKNE